MVTAVYGTDLSLIDDAQAVGSYAATGGGASALGDETDYFINGTQCISKSGFTATQKGIIHDDVAAPTITAGDAVFIWGRQANRNILDTVANSGGAVIMGTSNAIFQGFNVDGNNVDGSNLLSWINYAVDPTQTESYTSGSPGAASTFDHFGMEWKILGSGTLKGSPNAVGVIRYGRELQCINGHQFPDLKEICYPVGLFKLLVQVLLFTGYFQIFPEFGLQFPDHYYGFFQSLFIPCHTHEFPHDLAKLFMEGICTALTLDVH